MKPCNLENLLLLIRGGGVEFGGTDGDPHVQFLQNAPCNASPKMVAVCGPTGQTGPTVHRTLHPSTIVYGLRRWNHLSQERTRGTWGARSSVHCAQKRRARAVSLGRLPTSRTHHTNWEQRWSPGKAEVDLSREPPCVKSVRQCQ